MKLIKLTHAVMGKALFLNPDHIQYIYFTASVQGHDMSVIEMANRIFEVKESPEQIQKLIQEAL